MASAQYPLSSSASNKLTLTLSGPAGPTGLDAYQLAVGQGFVGTLEQWLDSQNEAAIFAEAAANSAAVATERKNAAAASAVTAGNQATAAGFSASAANTSAFNAQQSASAANLSASNASGFAGTATTKAQQASDSALAASGSAGTATTKAAEALGSANAAALSAANALTSEGLASDHKVAAATSAGDALGHANAASGSAGVADGHRSDASGFATAASDSADDALGYANAASDSAVAAAGSVSSISDFATAASNSADAAAGSVASISGFADAASDSAEAAAQSVIDAANVSRLTLGTVSTSAPGADGSVTITGTAGAQELNFVVPQGPQGIGPVTIADDAPTAPTNGMLWMGLASEVLSIYSTTKARWIVPIARGLDPDAEAVIYALTQQSATVTAAQTSAIDSFFRTGKIQGWYKQLRRFYLPIWGNHGPNAIDWIGLGSGSFQGDVTPGAGFVKSDGTTGWMDTNVGLITLGLSLSSYHFAGLYKSSSGAPNSYLFGAQSGSNTSRIFMTGTTITGDLSSPTLGRAAGVLASGDRLGVITFSGGQSNRFLKRRKSDGVTQLGATTTTITAQPNNNNVAFLANNSSGTIANFCGEEIGAFSIGLELTDAQDTAYSLALATLWQTCTGLTLP